MIVCCLPHLLNGVFIRVYEVFFPIKFPINTLGWGSHSVARGS